MNSDLSCFCVFPLLIRGEEHSASSEVQAAGLQRQAGETPPFKPSSSRFLVQHLTVTPLPVFHSFLLLSIMLADL